MAEDTQIEDVVRQMLASPQGLLGKQFYPTMGAGRNDSGRVPSCLLFRSTNQSIPNGGVWTSISFDTERIDTDAMHDPTGAPTRIMARTFGVYAIDGGVAWGAATTSSFMGILKNGATFIKITQGDSAYSSISVIALLAAGEYVELQVQHATAAGAVNASTVADYSPVFSATLIGNL